MREADEASGASEAAAPAGGASEPSAPERARGLGFAARNFSRGVRGDFAAMQEGRARYLGDRLKSWQMPLEAVRKIGFQMMVAIRAMHFFRDSGFSLGAQFAARMIRYVYNAEIHWDAQLAPGIAIIHGNGLVIGATAKVAEGCVLSQNVTLGAAFDSSAGTNLAPTLERNVHIGPGCTLIGNIVVGAESKLMAGAVLTVSVPPGSLVAPVPPNIGLRRARTAGGAAASKDAVNGSGASKDAAEAGAAEPGGAPGGAAEIGK